MSELHRYRVEIRVREPQSLRQYAGTVNATRPQVAACRALQGAQVLAANEGRPLHPDARFTVRLHLAK